jgi:hypothetical protein
MSSFPRIPHLSPEAQLVEERAMLRVSDVEWLHSLPFVPAMKSKLRNIMSAVFTHAIRYEWTHHNTITNVRVSSKRLREPDVLTPV